MRQAQAGRAGELAGRTASGDIAGRQQKHRVRQDRTVILNSRKSVINIRAGQDESVFGKRPVRQAPQADKKRQKGQAERIRKEERHVSEAGNNRKGSIHFLSLQGGDKNETSWLGKGFILLLEGFAYLDLSSKENQREANPRYLLCSCQFKGFSQTRGLQRNVVYHS